MAKAAADTHAADVSSPPPIGTPPAGGRWTWDGAQWAPLPEPAEPAAPTEPTEPAKE